LRSSLFSFPRWMQLFRFRRWESRGRF
jgi:hypothetical protein